MLNLNAFKHAAFVRQILLSIRQDDIFKWPIFAYMRESSIKKEAVSLLFEFVKLYSEIKPELDITRFLNTAVLEKRYQSWLKVAQSSTGRCEYSGNRVAMLE